MMEDRRELLRKIPKIDEVLQDERLFFYGKYAQSSDCGIGQGSHPRAEEGHPGRQKESGGDQGNTDDRNRGPHYRQEEKSLRRVINATGVVLHTNLGRANLSDKACESIMDVARNYTNLEYDVKRGSRGSRHDHVEKILTKITGAEAAMVVNNNAAATMLCLSALAKDKEVIVSRGELVEIGGSFRVPEIMEQSGAKLMDVGTTNKTKPSDYLNAYHEGETGALMKVHTSNYRILGFTQEVELPEMVELGKKLNLPVIYDMGSGLMADLTDYGVDEPTVLDALRTGIDVILFSGDKLLGGPQGGIIAGKKEFIDKMKAHPLARAFRVDKMTLAAMEATFFEYSDIRQARRTIPVLNMITTPAGELKCRAERLAGDIRSAVHNFTVEVEACKDQVGEAPRPPCYWTDMRWPFREKHWRRKRLSAFFAGKKFQLL